MAWMSDISDVLWSLVFFQLLSSARILSLKSFACLLGLFVMSLMMIPRLDFHLIPRYNKLDNCFPLFQMDTAGKKFPEIEFRH